MLAQQANVMTESMPSKMEIFSGWKEIANYLGKGVRTVQRYEREMRLPIHRPAGKSHGAVVASKTELDRWVTESPSRRVLASTWTAERVNRLGANFLQIDSEIALTFAGIALETRNQDKRARTVQTAQNAYDTITRLRRGIRLTDAESDKLDANLRRLRTELLKLGHSLS